MTGVANREAAKRIHKEVEQELKQLAKKLVAEKAGEGMSATAVVRIFRKRPAAFANFERDVVQLLLLGDKFLAMSNADIAKHMSGKYPNFAVPPSLFYSPLKPWAKKNIQVLLSQHGKQLDLSGKPTLSSIKKAIKGDVARKKPHREYGATFSFTDNEVVVNGRAYGITVTAKGYRRIRIGQQWLPVDTLEALLSNDSPPCLSE